ncbi:MAG: hypothetical protein QW808_02720 [Desulfurococcaceae archaeon]
MSSYDKIPGFEYWNIDAWLNFIKSYVLPLHISISKLLKLREFILTAVGTSGEVTLSEVERERNDILPFLLGGIKEDGTYKDNSLANFTRLAFGIYVDPKAWAALEMEEGLKASDYVVVEVRNTQFMKFLSELERTILRILGIAGVEPKEVLESEIAEVVQKPGEELPKIMGSLYGECLQVSANYNYYTFFALSTRAILFKLMEKAYPKLASNLNSLRNFLGLKKIFEPKINESEKREKYSIWSHLENSLCDCLYNLNQLIWKYFADESVKKVLSFVSPSVKDLRQEFVQKARQKLEEIGQQFPDCIFKLTSSYKKTYTISGLMVIKEEEIISYRNREKGECNISLFKLLDDLSLALFFDLITLVKITDGELEIERK